MSVIQKIQDKYGKVMAIIIALALVIFVIMLAFENGGSLFQDDRTTIGKVNGEAIEYNRFKEMADQQSSIIKQRGMGGSGEMLTQQANDAAWNAEIAQKLINQEAEKVGIKIGKKELNDLLFGQNPPNELRQAFTDPQTGIYNPSVAQQQINQIKSKGTAEQKASLSGFLDQMLLQRLAEKYDGLLTNSLNFPRWMLEKEYALNSMLSKVSYVSVPYTKISDSSVTVSDAEIQSYIDKHKKDFKQQESRSISYVAFSAEPNAKDSAAAKESIMAIKAAFSSAANVKDYLITQGENNFYDGYISSDRIQVPMKDSILRVGAGNVYGPYIDGGNYALAKVVGIKSMPDTVSIRHILIGTVQQDPQSGQQIPIRDTAEAKKLADSVALAIRNGASFDSLLAKFSTDQGSVNNGGKYENVPSGQMVPSFNDFIFGNPVGSKGVVKTEFGYHYVEILSQKGSSTGYKIAYITKPIETSQETDMAANNLASKFAGEASADKNTFELAANAYQKAHSVHKSLAQDIPPTGASIQGLGVSRTFVKNIYAAKVGEILQPERVGDYYVVALVTEANNEGTMSPAKARAMVAPLLINKKKGEMLISKIGKVSTLEAAAALLNSPVAVADSLRFYGQTSSLGFEPKVIGAAFNKENTNKVVSVPIAGTQGVYVIKVDNLSNTPVQAANFDESRKIRVSQAKQQAQFQSLQSLKDAATIKDYRTKFY